MKKPNFFFIGAPKCGTTSIAYHLSQHPNIFMSNPKEPHFFEEEISRGIKSLRIYESLFSKANNEHKVVGEASTGYLYSKDAIKKILLYSPSAKFLVSIRNPFEMAVSLHGQAIRGGYEDVSDFSSAWRLQANRQSGLNIPKACISNLLLLYKDRCALGDQLERLHSIVEKNRVFIALFDDLKAKPGLLYSQIYNFLELSNDGNYNFPVLNNKIELRWQSLSRWIRFFGKLKMRLGIYSSLGLANIIIKTTAKPSIGTITIDSDVLEDMNNFFSLQVQKIECLLSRDLKSWYYNK